MLRYLIIRVLSLAVTMFVIFTFCYFALNFAQYALYTDLTFAAYFEKTWMMYQLYVGAIVKHNWWGFTKDGTPLWDVLADRSVISLKINAIAFFIYLPGGVVIGILSGIYQGSWFDRFFSFFNSIFAAIPVHILMSMLVYYLGFRLHFGHYQYVRGWGSINFVLPVMALLFKPVAELSRLVRSELIESTTAEYILLARVKGLSRPRALFRHSLRNSLITIIPEIPNVFMYALTGSFFVEIIYGIPGLARFLYDNLIAVSPIGTLFVMIDIYPVMVILMFYAGISLLMNLVADVSLGFIDPRIRLYE